MYVSISRQGPDSVLRIQIQRFAGTEGVTSPPARQCKQDISGGANRLGWWWGVGRVSALTLGNTPWSYLTLTKLDVWSTLVTKYHSWSCLILPTGVGHIDSESAQHFWLAKTLKTHTTCLHESLRPKIFFFYCANCLEQTPTQLAPPQWGTADWN